MISRAVDSVARPGRRLARATLRGGDVARVESRALALSAGIAHETTDGTATYY